MGNKDVQPISSGQLIGHNAQPLGPASSHSCLGTGRGPEATPDGAGGGPESGVTKLRGLQGGGYEDSHGADDIGDVRATERLTLATLGAIHTGQG